MPSTSRSSAGDGWRPVPHRTTKRPPTISPRTGVGTKRAECRGKPGQQLAGGPARVLHPVRSPDRLPGLPHVAPGGAVGHRERRIAEALEPLARHPVAGQGAEQPPARVEEIGADHVGRQRLRHLAGHPAHRFIGREVVREDPAHREQRFGLPQPLLGLLPAPLGLAVEPGVLQRHRGLIGERGGEPEVALVERPVFRVGHEQAADHAVLDQERERHAGPVRRLLDRPPEVGGQHDARIGQHVRGVGRPPSRRATPIRPGSGGEDQPGRKAGADVAGAGHDHQRAAVGDHLEEPGGPDSQQVAQRLDDPPGHLLAVERLGDGPVHVGEHVGRPGPRARSRRGADRTALPRSRARTVAISSADSRGRTR